MMACRFYNRVQRLPGGGVVHQVMRQYPNRATAVFARKSQLPRQLAGNPAQGTTRSPALPVDDVDMGVGVPQGCIAWLSGSAES